MDEYISLVLKDFQVRLWLYECVVCWAQHRGEAFEHHGLEMEHSSGLYGGRERTGSIHGKESFYFYELHLRFPSPFQYLDTAQGWYT